MEALLLFVAPEPGRAVALGKGGLANRITLSICALSREIRIDSRNDLQKVLAFSMRS